MAPSSTAPVRKAIVRLTIGSFSLAALLGIVALLGGDAFGQTQGRILMTTLLVGVVSIAVLCYLATAGKPFQAVGVGGGLVVLVPLVTALLMIWGDVQRGPSETALRVFGVGAIVAATLAQASLLLALGEIARPLARRVLVGTLVLAALLAVLASALVTGYEPDGDGFYRVLGVVAILDVLGTVVAAALMKFGPGEPARGGADAGLTLPPGLAARLDEHAARTGRSRDDVAVTAIERYLGSAE